MKNSVEVTRFQIWSVLPPKLVERIRRHYHAVHGTRFTPSKAFARFCHELITDEAFRERIQTTAGKLKPIVFGAENPSWGIWPIDPEDCAGIGFFLGLSLEESLSDYLAELPESRLLCLEQEVVHSGTPLEEIFIKTLVESKTVAEYPADPCDRKEQ
jgi:hypothetical protein